MSTEMERCIDALKTAQENVAHITSQMVSCADVESSDEEDTTTITVDTCEWEELKDALSAWSEASQAFLSCASNKTDDNMTGMADRDLHEGIDNE